MIAALAPIAIGVSAAAWSLVAEASGLGNVAQIVGSGVVAGVVALALRSRQ